MKFHEVPPALAPDIWPIVSPWLDEALDHQLWLRIDDVLALVLAGRATLVVLEDGGDILAAAAVEVQEYPSALVGNVVAMGGPRGRFLAGYLDACIDWFRAWCARQGCGSMMLMGRPGWARLFGRRGWRTRRGMVAWSHLDGPGDVW